MRIRTIRSKDKCAGKTITSRDVHKAEAKKAATNAQQYPRMERFLKDCTVVQVWDIYHNMQCEFREGKWMFRWIENREHVDNSGVVCGTFDDIEKDGPVINWDETFTYGTKPPCMHQLRARWSPWVDLNRLISLMGKVQKHHVVWTERYSLLEKNKAVFDVFKSRRFTIKNHRYQSSYNKTGSHIGKDNRSAHAKSEAKEANRAALMRSLPI
ncbi:hypothetical protein [Vibrio phage vB_VmeM-Yong XC32]|nr:hypothetical protein [Vibrio phage vB_VmeM-Yong XC31]QAX96542.1 hypothetical protein [Vibrio phage vB_VmeM-Yong XC32]QAX96860.1 hypothetical protein [Vibrio phage vB_VmeM-Yong MS31]QAX97165.1 hypothetical protein [Vibrio phage vB_VmeM-Yong MS32]